MVDSYKAPVITLTKPTPVETEIPEEVHEQQVATNDIMQFFAEQMREVTKAQEKQLKKLSNENKLLRSRLTEMMANMTDRDLVKAKKVIIRPKRVPGPAIEFKGKDLMNYTPLEGPSAFGRFLAQVIFGEEKNCMLREFRLGVVVARKNSRKKCPEELEKMFEDVVRRNFAEDADKALKTAIGGANQYGNEMKAKHGAKISNEDDESTQDDTASRTH